MKVCISSGHGLFVRGASGFIDEVDEARLVVEEVARIMRAAGADVITFHDDISKTQTDNLNRIANFHNRAFDGTVDLNVSAHFNAYETTSNPMGSEVLYLTQEELAQTVVDKLCDDVGFINRGAKYRADLKFLNSTKAAAILLEICFVDSQADSILYQEQFEQVCIALAEGIMGEDAELIPTPQPPSGALFSATGTCSTFGGPEDDGVSPTEQLAFIYAVDEAPHLFLPYQPSGTTGLARRLNPWVHYIACRFDYSVTSKTMLRDSGQMALVTAKKTGISLRAIPADWGPHEEQTGRAADLSPSLMQDLGITTDDEVLVVYPETEA
jgi:N-acetylmuramoyl-L-alanine amidase